MYTPKYIVLHTAANLDPTYNAARIRDDHKIQGWGDIGYHYVVLIDGTLEEGRPISQPGAHARGLNRRSIGICMTGHGDHSDWTDDQYETLLSLLVDLCETHQLGVDHVIGHREVNELLEERWHTTKTCPGKMVDMDVLRSLLFDRLHQMTC